ncbi:MAG TPA: hypothetical protein VML94_03335 [Thermoplasmata archaeon]|nr:hypothetical protein [Thermoplasmata archaeon]
MEVPDARDPAEFTDPEDIELRWVGVALYGLLLLATAGLLLESTRELRPLEFGFVLMVVGVLVAFLVSILFAISLGGETAEGVAAAGITILGVGIWFYTHHSAGWMLILRGMAVAGAVLLAIGGFVAGMHHRRNRPR